MKLFSLKSKLVAATAATAILSSGMAVAQESDSKIMMGFNPFSSSNNIAVSSAVAPSYMIGFKVSETLVPYAYLTVADYQARDGSGTDTGIALGGGARMYLGDISNQIRPFAGGALGLVNQDDTGFALGAFFGAEAMITDGISISGQIGAGLSDAGCNGCDTQLELGAGNVMFNLYF
ncbi:hypothetical protein [uncultured Marinobacter sp.]|uniref:hypothetical protein n=1 Tax=uncultured Marinobacter sp. TaxID=187379 RepID=UPI00263A098F|nr:hypothetical protein [uncultured Marinobacter sp.]